MLGITKYVIRIFVPLLRNCLPERRGEQGREKAPNSRGGHGNLTDLQKGRVARGFANFYFLEEFLNWGKPLWNHFVAKLLEGDADDGEAGGGKGVGVGVGIGGGIDLGGRIYWGGEGDFFAKEILDVERSGQWGFLRAKI